MGGKFVKKIIRLGLAFSLFTFSLQGITHAESKALPIKQELKKSFKSNIPKGNLLDFFSFNEINRLTETKQHTNQKIIKSSTDDIRYEVEPNDDFDTANLLNMKYYISGTIDGYDDIDLFEIKITKSGKYDLVGNTAEENYMDLGIGIFDEYENLLEPVDGLDDGKGKARGYYLIPGTYYLAAIDLNEYGFDEDYLMRLSAVDDSTPKDTTAPSRPKVNQIEDNDTRVTGTAEANSQIYIQAEDDWISTSSYADSKGKFSIKIPKQKAGTFISICAIDEAGNQSKFADQWVIDKTAPATLTVKTVTTKTTYVTGKTEAKAKVQVKHGNTPLGTATADSKGNYKVKIAKQKKGKKLTVIARDSAKNAKTVYTTVK